MPDRESSHADDRLVALEARVLELEARVAGGRWRRVIPYHLRARASDAASGSPGVCGSRPIGLQP